MITVNFFMWNSWWKQSIRGYITSFSRFYFFTALL